MVQGAVPKELSVCLWRMTSRKSAPEKSRIPLPGGDISFVLQGNHVAATQAVPRFIDKSLIEEAVRIATQNDGVLRVLPLGQARVAIVITGIEVHYGRNQDRFEFDL